jgi:uncharacterized protein YbjT (DUF2867 family)
VNRTLDPPRSIAVFGAAGRMGGPLARHVRYIAPEVRLRLITSSPAKRDALRAEFPEAECVLADYFDFDSLRKAMAGIEGLFIITPAPLDEATAMGNLVRALKITADMRHIVRIVGYEPESLPRRVPEHVRQFGGTAQQHYVAKALLDESDLPLTYLNIGASYMDNFLSLTPAISQQGTVIWPDRLLSYIDARDVGEIAANILLSPDARHLYQFHTLNNGHDLLTTAQVIEMLSDILKIRLRHDSSRASFVAAYGDRLAKSRGVPHAAEAILDFIEYEQGNSVFLTLNDFAARTLGRQPTTLRAWFMEHKHHFSAPQLIGVQ